MATPTQHSTATTKEAKAFRSHSDLLMTQMQPADIIPLGVQLFAKHIISENVKEVLDNNHLGKPERVTRLIDAIIGYLQCSPENFKNVLDVFRSEAVYKELVDQIEETYRKIDTSTLSPISVPSSPISRYASYIRKFYKRVPFPTTNKYSSPHCQKIIKLAAVETKSGQIAREPFDPKKFTRFDSVDEYVKCSNVSLFSLTDLLETKDDIDPRVVIVQGAPGIGKTTFSWKFCQEWAEGRLYQRYELVVLLQLRMDYVRKAKELKDLFKHLDPQLSKNVADQVIAQDGENVVFIFEGLDELPSHYFEEESLLLEIFEGILPALTIVVTSRPWAAQKLVDLTNNQITRQVDIIGFLKEDIYDYIKHSFDTEEKLIEFRRYFSTHPQLEMIMYSPLNCAFVVQIYKDLSKRQSKEEFPRTLTQLYTALVKRFILQYMKNTSDLSHTTFVDLKSLPMPVYAYFEKLCHMAFSSFNKAVFQVTFSDAEVGGIETLGLLQSVPDTSINADSSQIHSFLHFTIQEFLAAFHLSMQPPKQQEWYLQTNGSDPKFSVFFTFLIGLNSSIVKHLKRPTLSNELEPHLLQWLFESQSSQDVSTFLGTDVVYFQTYTKLAPIDVYSLTYCLRHSNCTWNLIVDLEDLTIVYDNTVSDAQFNGRIDELSIFNAKASALQKFFSLPKYLFEKIRFLYFYNREDVNIEVDYYSTLSSLLHGGLFQNLIEFQFNDFPRTAEFGEVIRALCACCSRLETLKFERCRFTKSDVLPLCEYLSSKTSRLSRLALINVTFEDQSLQCICSALPYTKVLKRLDFSFNNLSQSDVDWLSLGIESSNIQALRLRSCSIDQEKVETLAKSLKSNSSIEFLSLAKNHIKYGGAEALAEMLKVNSTLQDIRLNGDPSITPSGATVLIEALSDNKTLNRIEIDECCEPVTYGTAMLAKTNRVKFV